VTDWFFTNDLHGQSTHYEQLVAITAAHRPRVVIVGGDLGPHAMGDAGVRQQRVFLEGFVVEFARRVREASARTSLLLLMGNDDWSANHDVLERHDGELWSLLHERVVEIDGTSVAGISWVPITPFSMKDWERWEDGGEESPPRLDGWRSEPGRLVPFRFDPMRRAPTIADSLAAMEVRLPSPGGVLVSHSPPRDTACDVVKGGAHVGSRAVRAWVERRRPSLVLSGHIHESPRVSGAWRDRIGDAEVVNPGQFGERVLCGVWFDPARPAETLCHTVHH
jgi:uncharacterized protein